MMQQQEAAQVALMERHDCEAAAKAIMTQQRMTVTIK